MKGFLAECNWTSNWVLTYLHAPEMTDELSTIGFDSSNKSNRCWQSFKSDVKISQESKQKHLELIENQISKSPRTCKLHCHKLECVGIDFTLLYNPFYIISGRFLVPCTMIANSSGYMTFLHYKWYHRGLALKIKLLIPYMTFSAGGNLHSFNLDPSIEFSKNVNMLLWFSVTNFEQFRIGKVLSMF